MSLEMLSERIGKCNRCGKNRFWYFPSCKGIDGFFGSKDYLFVCPQPHEGEFDPFTIRFDKRLYDNMKKHGFSNAHLTDIVKCRGEKYKQLTDEEIGNCIHWLREEIEIVKPKAIIAMGSKSFAALKAHGFKPVIMINHYAFYLENDKDYDNDFKKLRRYLDKGKITHGTKIK